MKNNSINRILCFVTLVVAMFLAQNVSAQYDYGTGLVAGNPTGGSATIVYSGNDATITTSGTIATGSTGVYNFHNLTIPAGISVTVSGNAPLIMKCTGTATINGTIDAKGGAGTYGVGYNTTLAYAQGGPGGVGGGGWGGAGGAGDSATVGQSANMFGHTGGQFATYNGGGKGGHNYNPASILQAGTGGSYGTLGGTAPAVLNSGTVYYSVANNSLSTIYSDANLSAVATVNGITTNLLGGSGGGGGGGRNQTANQAGIWGGCGGGGGGGAIRVTASDIVLGTGALITVRGGDGGSDSSISNPPGHGVGAGGGGSGGTINLQYAYTLSSTVVNNTPTFTAGSNIDIGGGDKGFGANVNGTNTTYYSISGIGGQGRFLAQQDPNPPTACTAPTLTAKANGTTSVLTLCSGTIALTANAIGGTGCTGHNEYSWSNGTNYWNGSNFSLASPTFSQADSNITVTQNGSTTVTYTVTARCNTNTGCSSTSSVTVTALGQPTAPDTAVLNPATSSVCVGANVTLASAAGGGNAGISCAIEYRYSTDGGSTWSNANTAIPSFAAVGGLGQNIIQARRNTCQSGCNGPTSWATVATWDGISGNTNPTITISTPLTTLCAGTPATFTAVSTNGGSAPGYQWYKNGSVQSGNTPTFTDATPVNHDSIYCVLTSNASCASVHTASSNGILLTVLPVQNTTITTSICQGQTYGGHSASGNFIDTLSGSNGCDSIRTLHLTVLQNSTSGFVQTICQGQTFMGYSATGTFIDTFTAANTCDSIRTIHLTVLPSSFSTLNQTICAGLDFEGYTATGVYRDTFFANNGCDSIRTLNLTVTPAIVTNISRSICQGRSYEGHNTTGIFSDTFVANGGCDSIRILNLTISFSITTTDSATLCAGTVYQGHTTPGNYIDTFTSVGGCDSIRTLHLKSILASTNSVKPVICQGDNYAGHTTSGTYLDTIKSSTGCDSLYLTIELEVRQRHAIPTITQSGDTLTSSLAGDYQWYEDSTLLVGQTNQTLVITHSGHYTVYVADSVSCSTPSDVFNGIGVGIAEVNAAPLLSIYPNPANDIVKIKLSGLKENSEAIIRMYDAIGRLVMEKTYTNTANIFEQQISIKTIGEGLYMIQVQQGNWSVGRKLLIVK